MWVANQRWEDFLCRTSWYRKSTMSTCITRRKGFAEIVHWLLAGNTHVEWKIIIFLLLLCSENTWNPVAFHCIAWNDKNCRKRKYSCLPHSMAAMSVAHILRQFPHLPEMIQPINHHNPSIPPPILYIKIHQSNSRALWRRVTGISAEEASSDSWVFAPRLPCLSTQQPTRSSFINILSNDIKRWNGNNIKRLVLTCSLCPWGKYTTRVPILGRDTRGPAQACQSSEFKHLFSFTVVIIIEYFATNDYEKKMKMKIDEEEEETMWYTFLRQLSQTNSRNFHLLIGYQQLLWAVFSIELEMGFCPQIQLQNSTTTAMPSSSSEGVKIK